MTELERHIEILLLGNDCVIVPGLGGFVAHHANARFDECDGIFLPPLRTIGFNQQLNMNDSLLAQSYVEAYDISYPYAIQRIENEVKTLRKQLEEEGKYELNDIGTLCINDDGNIEFTPCEAGILTPDFYGLSSFSLPKLSSNNTAEEKPSKDIHKGIIYIDSSPGNRHKTLNIRLSALRNAAVAAAVLVFSFIITPQADNTGKDVQTEKAESCILHNVLTNNNVKQNGNISTANKKEENHSKGTTPAASARQKSTSRQDKEKAQDTPSGLKTSNPYWCIVLCSHVQLGNARIFSSQLTKEGITNTIIEGKNGTAKVVYGNYATEREAYSILNSMQGNARFKQGWITKIEKTK